MLMSVLIMGAVAVSIATSVLLSGVGFSKSSLVQQQGYQAQALADSCGEIAVENIQEDANYAGDETIVIGLGECEIFPITESGGVKTINVEGSVGSLTRRAQIEVTGEVGGGAVGVEQSYFENFTFVTQASTQSVSGRDRHTPANSSDGISITVVTGDNNSGTCGPVPPAPTVTPVITIGGATMDAGNVEDVTVSPGDAMTFHGENFQAGGLDTDVDIFTTTSDWGTCPLALTATSFNNCSITAPTIVAGTYNVFGKNTSLLCTVTSRAQKVTIVPKITITGTSCGTNPKTITLNGSGFGASKTVTIIWDNKDTLTTRTTGTDGAFTSTVSFPIPESGSSHTIRGKDNSLTPNFTPIALANPC